MTDDQIKALDQCARAVQSALTECARTREIDPLQGDVTDPVWCLAVEATCLLTVVRDLRGKPHFKEHYA